MTQRRRLDHHLLQASAAAGVEVREGSRVRSVERDPVVVTGYLGLLVVMFFAERVSLAPSLLLVLPTAGFLIRVFIVFHDCTHGSFMRTRRANNVVGAVLGVLVWLPFRSWQHEHAVHHATAGDLDRRGIGDVTTLTVAEYAAMPTLSRVGYRLSRNPIVMFGLGWLLVMVLKPRFVPRGALRRIRTSILATDVVIAIVVVATCLTVGWRAYLLVQWPVFAVSGTVGIWLFYVQHQFEGTYWQKHADWRYDHAALQGSSYLKLPAVLQFFTGNIGFHHVHHLNVGIPNYNLQDAHDQTTRLHSVPELTLRDGLRATRLKLWDESREALVTFRDARRLDESDHSQSLPGKSAPSPAAKAPATRPQPADRVRVLVEVGRAVGNSGSRWLASISTEGVAGPKRALIA